MNEDREKLKDLIKLCTLCGSCNNSCPVYNIELSEPYSPRGRINLIKEFMNGNIPDSKRMKELISVCLMCGYCQNSCSRGVDFRSIFSGFLSLSDLSENESSD